MIVVYMASMCCVYANPDIFQMPDGVLIICSQVWTIAELRLETLRYRNMC